VHVQDDAAPPLLTPLRIVQYPVARKYVVDIVQESLQLGSNLHDFLIVAHGIDPVDQRRYAHANPKRHCGIHLHLIVRDLVDRFGRREFFHIQKQLRVVEIAGRAA